MRKPRRLLALLVLLCFATTSCFTSMLWSIDSPELSYDIDLTNARARDASHDAKHESSGIPVWGKILLTPVTLLLDLLTLPLQDAIFGEDDGHGSDCACPGCRD